MSSRVTSSSPVTSFRSNASTVRSRNSDAAWVASRRISSGRTNTPGASRFFAYTHSPVGFLAPRLRPSGAAAPFALSVISAAGLSSPYSASEPGVAVISRSIRALTMSETALSMLPLAPVPDTGSSICQPSPRRRSRRVSAGRLTTSSSTDLSSTTQTRFLVCSRFSCRGPRYSTSTT